MRRREFIALVGGLSAGWPLAASAQQPAKPRIGYLSSRSPDSDAPYLEPFREGLKENGYIENQSVQIEYRWAQGQYDKLPALAAEFVRLPVEVLVAVGGEPSAVAAKTATSTIPIVFMIGSDPIKAGLVESDNHPGGNATGINILTDSLGAKRLSLLHEIVASTTTIGFLINPRFESADSQLRMVQETARSLGMSVSVLLAATDSEIDAAFNNAAQQRLPALMIGADPFFDTRVERLVALAAHYAVPTMYQFRDFAEGGGLMSYGIDLSDLYRQAGVYSGRILKGERPADLPVLQPTKFELVINMKTANALGLAIPPSVLAIADEVIE
jgi:putative tryptophan/tyrosine transport system substrate-binding protein